MKIITKLSVENFETDDPRVRKLLDDIKAAGASEQLDTMLDLIWQAAGLTREEWVKYLKEEEAHIRARFIN